MPSLTPYIEGLVTQVAAYPILTVVVVFLIAMGEALFVIGLFVPSTVVLVGVGMLVGTGQLSFWPIFVSASLGAIAGDAASYWFGHTYKEGVRRFWPFNRYTFMLDRGEAFFARHGGKSIFIGRFIPGVKSVIPGVAGMMGMSATRFTVINVVSGIAWAAAHIIPAVALGRGIGATGAANPRVVELLVLAVIALIVLWYGTRLALRFALPLLDTARTFVLNALARHPSRWTGWARRALTGERDVVVPYAFVGAALLAVGGFLTLLLNLLFEPELAASDQAISGLFQSLRSEPVDQIMVLVTMAGDGTVVATLAAIFIVALLVARRWKLAAGVTIAIVTATAFVPIAKSLVGRARPTALYEGADSFSFPSGHATLSMVTFGVTALVLAHGLPWVWRRMIYLATAVVIGAIAFSRIYLAAHWPSDVVAGMLFGATLVACLAFVLHGWRLRLPNGWLAIAALGAFAVAYPIHVSRDLGTAQASYRIRDNIETVSTTAWMAGAWEKVPAFRSALDGDAGEPFAIQTDLPLPDLSAKLTTAGWNADPATGWVSGLASATIPSSSPLPGRAVLPYTDNGRLPIATFEQALPGAKRAVARVWATSVAVGPTVDDRPILTLSISGEELDPLVAGMSTVERADLPKALRTRLTEEIAATLGAKAVTSDAIPATVWLAPAP